MGGALDVMASWVLVGRAVLEDNGGFAIGLLDGISVEGAGEVVRGAELAWGAGGVLYRGAEKLELASGVGGVLDRGAEKLELAAGVGTVLV